VTIPFPGGSVIQVTAADPGGIGHLLTIDLDLDLAA